MDGNNDPVTEIDRLMSAAGDEAEKKKLLFLRNVFKQNNVLLRKQETEAIKGIIRSAVLTADRVRESQGYPAELFERQLDLISQELSLDEDFVRSLRTRLETFGRHVSLYKRRAGDINPEIIQNDILSNSPL